METRTNDKEDEMGEQERQAAEDRAYAEQVERNRIEDGDDLRPTSGTIKRAMAMRRKLNKE